MPSITTDTIPESFKKIFGNPPKDSQIYEIWINNLWNIWLTSLSEKEKYKYRSLDKNNSRKSNSFLQK